MTNFHDVETAERYGEYMAKHKARRDAVMSYPYPPQYRDLVSRIDETIAIHQENSAYFQTDEFNILPKQAQSRLETMDIVMNEYAGDLYWRLSGIYDQLQQEKRND
jgi:outer membrane protein OmpA-like peptidoglycan-associated protein